MKRISFTLASLNKNHLHLVWFLKIYFDSNISQLKVSEDFIFIQGQKLCDQV